MRLSIRWKLVLAALVPLTIGLGINLAVNYTRLAASAVEQSKDIIVRATELEAARLDTSLERVAQSVRTTARFLSHDAGLSHAIISNAVRDVVANDPLIFGSAAAFEPGVVGPGRFAPYWFRARDAIEHKDLAAAYDYTDPRWDWYALPRAAARATPGAGETWTEPYFDEGGGDVLMCTFAAPILRDGVFVGVVTADLRLDDLQQQGNPVRLPGYDGFVLLSRQGRFISAQNRSLLMKRTMIDLAREVRSRDAELLAQTMARGERGVQLLRDLPASEPLYVAFMPLQSTGWSYSAGIKRDVILAPVFAELRERGLFVLSIIATVATVIALLSFRLTRPVPRLAAAMEALGRGDLAARADVRSGDELQTLGDGFNAMTARLAEQIEEIKRQTAARQAVESDLRVAREIQESLLPRTFPPFPDRPEFELHAANLPARHVAGDFFDFFFTGTDELLMIIADVSGKGVPASMLMAVTRTLVRNVGLAGAGPADVLTRVNDALSRDNQSGLFVTAWVGMYTPSTGVLRWSSAGHPPPMLVSDAAPPNTIEGDTGLVLGILEGSVYDEHATTLRPGESILAYTDGVSEAKAPAGELFGEQRIRAILTTALRDEARAICDRVIREIDHYQQSQLADDVTVLALRRTNV